MQQPALLALAATTAMLALLTPLAGCQSTAPEATAQCALVKGMTTAELARCGCFSASKQSRYAIAPPPGTTSEPAQSVSILSYLCPIATKGFARVMVVNGVAEEILE